MNADSDGASTRYLPINRPSDIPAAMRFNDRALEDIKAFRMYLWATVVSGERFSVREITKDDEDPTPPAAAVIHMDKTFAYRMHINPHVPVSLVIDGHEHYLNTSLLLLPWETVALFGRLWSVLSVSARGVVVQESSLWGL
jgi:hypothetical protein